MSEGRVLIVDDKGTMLDLLERVLSPRFDVAKAAQRRSLCPGETVLQIARQQHVAG